MLLRPLREPGMLTLACHEIVACKSFMDLLDRDFEATACDLRGCSQLQQHLSTVPELVLPRLGSNTDCIALAPTQRSGRTHVVRTRGASPLDHVLGPVPGIRLTQKTPCCHYLP
jgi:hypothetical protein